jgi:hypothetical protein
MGDIMKKVTDQTPNRFLWLDVFLPADMAKSALDLSITIQTVLFGPFFEVRQWLNFD